MVAPSDKVLVLSSRSTVNATAIECLKAGCQVVQIDSIEQALESLRHEQFGAIFADAADFLPLERALVSQQANLILNTLGEGVCIVDGDGRANWMNKKMSAWPARIYETIRRTCQEAFELFTRQVSAPSPDAPQFNRSKRYALNIDDQQFFDMIASPVISPAGQVVQVAAVIWDATSTRRLQQKIDAIDNAGRELVRLEADALSKMNVAQRLKLLEEKIIRFSRDLMHFDHFAIRLLDRGTNKLELVIAVGLPPDAMAVELFAQSEGNGISGYVAASGRSYICPDVERDPRYVMGLDQARSSLTVPLRLHDKVIGIFNVESQHRAAFNEDDRQFAEIFGHYVALALNILDLMVFERATVSHKVADDVCAEAAGPLNDITCNVKSLMDDFAGDDGLRRKLQQIVDDVSRVRVCLRQAAAGPNTILGADDVKVEPDAVLAGARVLVADDEAAIRTTISDILRKYAMAVTAVASGSEAISLIQNQDYDLVLSDIRMPDKSGYDVFAAARKRSASLPVILMTGFGYDPNHSIVRASHEGLQCILFKPFRMDQLIEQARKALAANRALAST